MKRNKSKISSGITLVALVITIIVLLILAGVTLNLTLGENGLLRRAEESKNAYLSGERNDVEFLNNAYNYMNKYFGEGQIEAPYTGKLTIEERTKLKENGLKEITENSSLKNEDNVKGVITGEVPIPEGFSYIDGTKETGVVIKNDNDGNEFVWIPTEGWGYTYDRHAYAREESSDDQILGEFDTETNSYKIYLLGAYFTEAMPEDEQLSVNKYKGYYIGRYEAGISSENERQEADGNTSATASEIEAISGKPLTQANKNVYNYVTKVQAKGLAEGLYNKTENKVTSKLCSSYAWDTMLEFVKTKYGDWIYNSTGENCSTLKLGLQKTGYHCVNNIYDIGGNVEEWTTEKFSSSAGCPDVIRGGSYGEGAWAFFRNATDVSGSDTYGFRITLYL